LIQNPVWYFPQCLSQRHLFLLTPWSRILLERLIGFSASQNIPCFIWKPNVHCHMHNCPPPVSILSQIYLVHSLTSQFLETHLLLFSSLRLDHPSFLFPPGVPTMSLFTHLYLHTLHTCYILCLPHFLDLIIRTILGEVYRPLSSSLSSFLHSPVTTFDLVPNILLRILLSNSLCVRSSLSVSDHVIHSYKTTGKIIILHIIMFKFLNGERCAPKDSKHSQTSTCC
jgi:hypothetical protein